MELRNGKYALMAVTSMGVRLTPENRQPVNISRRYEMQATSAESNVLNISASLGLPVCVLTKFVKGSPIAAFIQSELRRRNIAYIGSEIEQDDPWGYRHQFNIADGGYGLRAPQVTNDRAGEVGRTLCAQDFDLQQIFEKDGCKILHLSGLIAALSPETGQCCLEIARTAKKNGTRISFDLNYRESFWKNRKEELKDVFHEIASLADILIGNEEDFQLALGLDGPKVNGADMGTAGLFRQMISRAGEAYANASVFAATLRQVKNANEHLWGALMYAEGNWYEEEQREIPVFDRIGGGDGFVGGMLYGILRGWEPYQWIQFGWATGAMAATVADDYATPMSEDQVWDIYRGNARVKR